MHIVIANTSKKRIDKKNHEYFEKKLGLWPLLWLFIIPSSLHLLDKQAQQEHR